MSRLSRQSFSIISFFNFGLGLIITVGYFILWASEQVQDLLETAIGEIYGDQFWLYSLVIIGLCALLTAAGYLLSFVAKYSARPRIRLYLLFLGLCYPIIALNAGTLGDDLFQPFTLSSLIILGLIVPLVLLGAEFLLGRFFLSLAMMLYKKEELGLARPFMNVAGTLIPESREGRKFNGLLAYRSGQAEQAGALLLTLFEQGERGPEVLSILGEMLVETGNWSKAQAVLEILHKQEPKNEQWVNHLITTYERLALHDKAIELLEQYGNYDDFNLVVRLQRLYFKADDKKAIELAGRMAQLESAPYPQSLLAYRALVKKYPENVELLESIARLCIEIGEEREAARYLETLLQLEPGRNELRQQIISLYRGTNQFPQLEKHLEYLIKQGESGPELLAEYCETMINNKQYELATQNLLKAKERYPLEYGFPYQLAQVYYSQEEFDKAQKEITGALALAAKDKKAMINILKGKIDGAILNRELKQLHREVEKHPDDVNLRFKLIEKLTANAYVERAAAELDFLLYKNPELKEQAMEHLKDLIEHYDHNFLLLSYLADLHLRDKNLNNVLELYQIMAQQSLHPREVLEEGCRKILNVEPSFAPALKTLGDVKRQVEQWQEMINYYEQALQIDASLDGEISQHLFVASYQLGLWDKAKKYGQETIERNPYDISNYKRLAEVYKKSGDLNQALSWLLKAKDVDIKDPEIYDMIREVNKEIKSERMGELRALLLTDPENTDYHFELAELHLFFERYNEAIPHYQKAGRDALRANISKVKLAYCLAMRRFFDLAVETLAEAHFDRESEKDIGTIKSTLFQIGELFEDEYEASAALKVYKQLFYLDAGYRNVVEKIEHLQRHLKKGPREPYRPA